LKQLLISQDIGFKHRLHHYGGQGYEYLLTNTLPWMKQRGFTQEEIDTIVIHNPRRLIERNPS
jgi:phosphotriesterase-related protein